MNKKRFILLLNITLTFFTIVNYGIYEFNNKKNVSVVSKEENNEVNKEEIENVLNFDEFQKLYEYLSGNIHINDFEKKYSTNHNSVTIIDPLWSFNSRKHLQLTNENLVLPTEEFMILENKNSTCQITISVCYNKYYIGNNLHSFTTSNADLKTINEKLTINTNSAVMSYDNILICVQIGRSKVEEGYIMGDVLTEISTKVMDYFK